MSAKMAVPGFSFFYMGLDASIQPDENGLVDIEAISKDYFLAWNDGDDGPVLAGPSSEPVFSVVETRRVFGKGTRRVSVSDFCASGDTVRYGRVMWRTSEDGSVVIVSATEPSWTDEQWKAMTSIATHILGGGRFINGQVELS